MQEQVFVAREQELADLAGDLQKALSGKGQVCFVVGQAGSGKTALVRHFVQQALSAYPDLVVAMGTCNAQTGIGDPFLPFREALAMLTADASAGQSADKMTPETASRLRTALVRSVQVLVEVAPELVGVFVPGAKLLGALGKAVATKAGWMDRLEKLVESEARVAGLAQPVADQGRIFDQYTAFLLRLSQEMPLILFLDDLQWADSASTSLLFHLGRHIETSRILILGAYRPDDVAMGRGGERHPLEPVVNELTRYHGDVTIDLDAIPEETSRQFVNALLDAGSHNLDESFRQALFHQTGGHALFTVELIRSMKERGDLLLDADGCWREEPNLDWSTLPPRVEGVVEERISRLDEDLRDLLLTASVEGEEFTAELIARVQRLSALEAVRMLSDSLTNQHRLIRPIGMLDFGAVRLSRYRFEHNLFQQYLYGSLSEVERACLHQELGNALETLFQGQTDAVAGKLAHHFEEASIPDKAAFYRLQAARQTFRLSAYQETMAHLNRGLELLADLPDGPSRIQLELDLQTSLAAALVVVQGYASPHVQGAYARARDLCRALGDPPLAIPALYGLCAYRFVRADLREAYEEGLQLLRMARQARDTCYTLGCLLVLGAAALHLGQLERAREHLEEVVSRYNRAEHGDLAHSLGHDPAVGAYSYLSFVLWHQGYPEQAIAAKNEALDLARELSHPYSHGYAASFAAMLSQMLGEWSDCRAQAEKALQIAGAGHFPLWQAIGSLTHGWASARLGLTSEGIMELVQGLALWEQSGALLATSYQRGLLADAFLAAGSREQGLLALEGSFCYPEETWWLPEQHRLRAELLLLAPDAEAEAEVSLRRSLELANEQKTRSLELRAATSLARLLQKQGRGAEGRDLLARCLDGFTEGLETPDLRTARQLLSMRQRAIPAVIP